MQVQTLLWVVLLAVAASIVISYFCKVNLGIPALIFAYIIGVFIQGMKVKEVVAQWPTGVVFQLMTITMFFSFAIFNGTLPKVADNIIYRFRNNAKTYFFDPGELRPVSGDHVIIETARGDEYGI